MPVIGIEDLDRIAESTILESDAKRAKITIHLGTCGIAAGAKKIADMLIGMLPETDVVSLTYSGCAGLCSREPMATVKLISRESIRYVDLTEEKIRQIFREHVIGGRIVEKYTLANDNFVSNQKLIVLKNRGEINPEKIDEYIARDGYKALAKSLSSMKPVEIIDEIKKSGLRGRGGAGFLTGRKWELCRNAPGDTKYVICNADEGNPGAYMDRSIIESDPHIILEGMLIGGRAIGASMGIIYIREEYPLARKTLEIALKQARDYGLVGENIFGTEFSFDIQIKQGAGAFLCGEETALIRSIEGRTPEPKQRPPFPAQSGLWQKPTNINNVETWANIPGVILNGSDWFSNIGTSKSSGTKVLSLSGKVNNTGLVEVPIGTSLRKIIYDIGGGIQNGKALKAIQTGGPSGGCIPASMIDLPVDYEELAEAYSVMGSGGMIVLDEDTCMVDMARFFLQYSSEESCGKCLSCREGSATLYEILDKICGGDGEEGDLILLEEIAYAVKDASMCGLGQTLPNPVLSTLRFFRDEYEAHIRGKHCPAKVCKMPYG